ncbi:MAG: hypothetical protein JWL73_1138 [Actinomycetia bacterium]|nr:hypothetical protein [Actinomycetes bacterium]
MSTAARPRWRELPEIPGTLARSAWGVFGSDDELGAVNLVTPQCAVDAATLVRTGATYRLDLPIDQPSPPLFGREPLRHEVFAISANVLDDYVDGLYLQGSTQWDALAHCSHGQAGFYNGFGLDDVRAGRLGIDTIAERGVVARGVLVDAARYRDSVGRPVDPLSGDLISVDDLTHALADQDSELRSGDVLCVRTGWMAWYLGLDDDGRQAASDISRDHDRHRLPGIGPGPELAEWLWDAGVAMVAADNPMVEPRPQPPRADGGTAPPAEMVHICVMVLLGIPLGELFDFEALAAACADDGRYEFMLTSAPLRMPGGIGSPPNALAIR